MSGFQSLNSNIVLFRKICMYNQVWYQSSCAFFSYVNEHKLKLEKKWSLTGMKFPTIQKFVKEF